jgi:hypothetical protein
VLESIIKVTGAIMYSRQREFKIRAVGVKRSVITKRRKSKGAIIAWRRRREFDETVPRDARIGRKLQGPFV